MVDIDLIIENNRIKIFSEKCFLIFCKKAHFNEKNMSLIAYKINFLPGSNIIN